MPQTPPTPPIDDPSRFMSTAVDWRRVLTMLLVSVPCAVAIAYGGQKVMEASLGEIQRRLDAQRAFFVDAIKAGDQANEQALRREVDQVRDDVRELRHELNDVRKDRGTRP